MSSYHGEVGAWDGGPPGAEADYAPHQAPPLAAPLPTTDPWTGVSYSQYGQPQYDYPTYNASGYGYTYDSTYYQGPEGGYYNSSRTVYPPQQDNYDYNQIPDHMRHRQESHDYNRQRPLYRSNSRTPPYREREYSIKRERSYDSRRHRSRSRSVSESKRISKYSSSDRSSRSRSYSKSPPKKAKNRRSKSSHSSRSGRFYNKNAARRSDSSMTPPLKCKKSRNRSSGKEQIHSRSPSREKSKSKVKTISSKQAKSRGRRDRDICTPPRKCSDSPKSRRKSDRSSFTPPTTYDRSDRSSQKKMKRKKSRTPPKKHRDTSVTPPRCYARSRSSSSSRSRSRSLTPKTKRNRSVTPKSTRSRSTSSSNSSKSSRCRSKRRLRRKSSSRGRSHSNSRSDRSTSERRSRSRRHSGSRGRRRSRTPKVSKSRSRSRSSRSRSRSRTPSEEECRGQFTVADRKRFWKLHRNRQERAEKSKTPPKEIKPPPGVEEATTDDDIVYGVPPEVEGPNYADLLPPPDQSMLAPSTSKSKTVSIPIKNDGSFLEMFKKMQEQTKQVEETVKKPEIKKPLLPFIGKRRGGRVLKTGLVKKAKAIDEQTVDNTPKDAWSLYMQEVKKYRETSCEEERKTRPLVK